MPSGFPTLTFPADRYYLPGHLASIHNRDAQFRALLPEENRGQRLIASLETLEKRQGRPVSGPSLSGALIGIKDIIRVDGLPTRCGSQLPSELFEGPEAECVRRLREAGAMVLGKTVTTEFAYFEPGPTRNPRNPEHTPGGSSSGSAAAVAAGYCPAAIGSQTVGSVIRPAAFCGVIGFKPSYGRASLEGVIPYAPSLDNLGWFVRDPVDLDPLGAALIPDWGSGYLEPAVFGVPVGPYLQQTEPATLDAFWRHVELLKGIGIEPKHIPFFEDIDAINERHQIIASAEMAIVHRDWFPKYQSLYRPRTAQQIRDGHANLPELESTLPSLLQLRQRLHNTMAEHGIRAWLSPAATGPAPWTIERTGDPAMNLPWTHAGLPVLTVPAGIAANGLPLGLQVTARFGDDEWLCAFASELQFALLNSTYRLHHGIASSPP